MLHLPPDQERKCVGSSENTGDVVKDTSVGLRMITTCLTEQELYPLNQIFPLVCVKILLFSFLGFALHVFLVL